MAQRKLLQKEVSTKDIGAEDQQAREERGSVGGELDVNG